MLITHFRYITTSCTTVTKICANIYGKNVVLSEAQYGYD